MNKGIVCASALVILNSVGPLSNASPLRFGGIPDSANSGPSPLKEAPNPKEIVFIHGMFMTPKCWTAWVKKFEGAGYRVSAPAWPLHEGTVEDLRKPARMAALGKLTLAEVIDSYRKLLREKPVKPILIGHSMGGLIAQILLAEGLGQAAVAIDSAPPKGIVVASWSFTKSNWPALNPFVSSDRPVELSLEQFSYAFSNQQTAEQSQKDYAEYYVPESRQVGRGPLKAVAKVPMHVRRGPLLIIAGEEDHIIPARLNYKNYRAYATAQAYTEFRMFKGRDHSTLVSDGWESVANEVESWIQRQFKD